MPKKEKQVKIKTNKKQDKKKNPFNLKEWIKMVIEKSSNKRNRVPKIPATFQFVVIEIEKNNGNQVIEIMKGIGSKINMTFLGNKATSKELKLLSIQENEIEMVLSLIPTKNIDKSICQHICECLKVQGISWLNVYSIKPSSADLNLIYLLRKGE